MSITSNQIFTDITLDVSGKSSLSNISANQGNIKSHFVKAKLRDDTQAYIPPSTATGLVSFLTPNNTKVYEDVVSISGDTVTFELTESMLGTAGMGLCDISIIDNGSVLMSATVKVSIKPKAVPNDDDIVKDSDEYNVLVNALATAQEGEAVRDNAESLRKSNESTRQTNEINRQQNLTTAIEAIIRADNATDNANSATDRANSATDRADDAADRANTSADRADDATSRANTAIATTEAATQEANNATDNAIDTATNLETTYSPRLTNVETHLADYASKFPDNAGAHNSIYRGEYLGSTVTTKQYENIQNGTFKDMYIGDYWTINGMDYLIAAFNYYLGIGDTGVTVNHITLVPRTALYNHVMNDTNITTGGYTGSKMYISGLNQAKTKIKADFSGHVLNHRKMLSNSTVDGKANGWAWVDSEVDLMNEVMVYGSTVWGESTTGGSGYNIAESKTQLPLFRFRPDMMSTRSHSIWLRDVVSAATFAGVYTSGYAGHGSASNAYGVRPDFSIS